MIKISYNEGGKIIKEIEYIKTDKMNFENVIKLLDYKAELYDCEIRKLETATTTNKSELLIKKYKKLLAEYESAIIFLKATPPNVTYTITKNYT